MSNLFSKVFTLWLMNSLPLSEWKPRMRNGNCSSMLSSSGSSHASGDVLDRSHHLPLRHFVHCIDVINTLGSVQIALMYRVHTQIAGPSAGLGLTALADRDRSGPGFM